MSSSLMPGVGSSPPAHLDVHSLSSPKLQKALQVLLKLTSSCAGPAGKVHAVCSSRGGHLTLTSTSSRLLASLSVTQPELKLILNLVRSHLDQSNDSGLFMTCICLQLVQLSVQTEIHFHIQRSLLETFVQIIVYYLRSLDCKITVKADFTDLPVLLTLVRSVVSSKRLLNLTGLDSTKLSELIVRAFVESIPSLPSHSKFIHSDLIDSKLIHSDLIDIVCVVKPSVSVSRLEHGLLLEYPEHLPGEGSADIQLKVRSVQGGTSGRADSHVRVALFTCSLSGDSEEVFDLTFEITKQQFEDVENTMLDKMADLCDTLEKSQVGLVLCQKVIHPKLKVALRSKGILFIDRLGSQRIPYLQDLTGAQPMASAFSKSNFAACLGWVDSVAHCVLHDRSYIHLTNTQSSVVTLVLCAQWEERLAELQSCVKTSLAGLYSLCQEPRLLAGGGCWQTHCSYLLRNKIHKELRAFAVQIGCTEAQVLSSLAVFRSSLHHWVRSLADSSQEVLVDLSSLHCWRVPTGRVTNATENKPRPCCCGLESASTNCLQDLDDPSGHEPASALLSSTASNTSKTENLDFSHLILDNMSAAVQALERGVFVANYVLSIGVSITGRN